MILKHLDALNKKQIILASASPRRLEILTNLGLRVKVVKSSFAEDLPKAGRTAGEYAEATAVCKARDVAAQVPDAELIIAADTVVDLRGEVMEKPDDAAHAKRMLSALSGHEHQVHTGVALILRKPNGPAEGSQRSFHATTLVRFAAVDGAEIDAYVATGEPLDKAGGYGIQGPATAWVERVDGCYFNVMGFPVNSFATALHGFLQSGLLVLDQ